MLCLSKVLLTPTTSLSALQQSRKSSLRRFLHDHFFRGISESDWKMSLYKLGMLSCYCFCVVFWIEFGSGGLKSFFQPLGMAFVTLWFIANFCVIREQDEEAGKLNGKLGEAEIQLRDSENARLYAEKRVSALEGIIEKARTRSRERRQGNNQ